MTDEEIVSKIVTEVINYRNKLAEFEVRKTVWIARKDKMVAAIMKQTGISLEDATYRVTRMIEEDYPQF